MVGVLLGDKVRVRERETEREMGECTIIDIYWQK